ncbi:WD repeat-containing protein 78-like isoform X2 [Lates japonicus]
MSGHAEKMKKASLTPNSSFRALNNSGSGIHQIGRSSRHPRNFAGSQGRKNSNSKLNCLDKGDQTHTRRAVRVLDEDGSDVTPLVLYHTDTGDTQSKQGMLFLEEIFSSSGLDHSQSTSSVNVCSSSSFQGSSRLSNLSNKASLTKESEDSISKLDIPIRPRALCELPRKRDHVKQHVTEEMLDEVVDIWLIETDTISLLDIPSTIVSEDADDAETIKERNIRYAELCKNRMGNDKFIVRSMQSFGGAPKNKQIQSDEIVTVDKGTTATAWDIYDSFHNQNETTESEFAYPESNLNSSKIQEKRGETSSSSTVGTGSTISSLLEKDICWDSSKAEPDPQRILQSDSFQHSLLVMERTIVANILQPKLSAYRQLPILEDCDSTAKPQTKKQCEEDKMSCLTPAIEHLWAFGCELTKGCSITSMAWNKKNPDLLAIGYGDIDPRNQKAGMICCWSIKNPLWPERIFYCHSCVTSLDFSANNPGQLAVGMFDGTVALYNVPCPDDRACIASSRESSEKHLHPVWQVTWIKQEMRSSGEERAEALVSVSADGRITKWFLCSNGLESIDLMMLRRVQNTKMEAPRSKKTTANDLSMVTPGLCVDFHPIDSSIYLVGTWEGLIHKCSVSNSQHFLDTYEKHFCPVNHVEWSPFCPNVFLSCSSDWTIQLWKQGLCAPVLTFTSTQRAVYTVRWSPIHSAVFAAINGRQVEIWDLNTRILYPTIVHQAAPDVKITALLFATGTDCVLVGDSDGQATVYELKNLSVGEGKQVDSLEDIIQSAVSKNVM